MQNGKYEVTDFVHIWSCRLGQLKIPKGSVVEINGRVAVADDVKFPTIMLEHSKESLRMIEQMGE